MKMTFKKKLDRYLLKNFGRDVQVVAIGLGCLFALQVAAIFFPVFMLDLFRVHIFSSVFSPDPYSATSIYAWIAYLVSGIIVGKIAKASPILLAVGAGCIFAILYTSLFEHLLPPSIYLYRTFPVA